MKKELKTFISFIVYSFLPYIIVYLYKFLPYKKDIPNEMDLLIIINTVLDIVFFVIFILLSKDIFKNNKKLNDGSKDRISENVALIIHVSIMFYIAKIASAMLVGFLTYIFKLDTLSINQQVVEATFKSAPLVMFITGTFLAPVVEELVFRGAVRRIIKNKKVFVIVSGLIFGLVHVLEYSLPIFMILITGYLIDMVVSSSLNKKMKVKLSICTIMSINPSEAVNSIAYIIAGMAFAAIYAKYDNIYLNIGIHAINNLLGYIVLFTYL